MATSQGGGMKKPPTQKAMAPTVAAVGAIRKNQTQLQFSAKFSATEAELLNGRVAHGMHPVLSMCAANAVVTKDPAGSRKLDKSRATGRIDGMVALAMAMGAAARAEQLTPAYETGQFMFV